MTKTPRLLLIDVDRDYYCAFSDWASEQGLEVIVCDRQTVVATRFRGRAHVGTAASRPDGPL